MDGGSRSGYVIRPTASPTGVRRRARAPRVSPARAPRAPRRPRRTCPRRGSRRSAPAPGSNRSRSRTARSASRPTASTPASSRWLAYADPAVAAARMSTSSSRSSGMNGLRAPVLRRDPVDRDLHLEERVGRRDAPVGAHDQRRAVARGASGTGTGAPTPRARGPAASGRVICASSTAHSGCAFASAPSRRKRGRSSGWMTWMCARCGRVSLQPFACRAASTASSAWRTARSPSAWKCGWNPRASSRTTTSRRTDRVDEVLAPVVGRVPVDVEVRLEHRRGLVLDDPVGHQLDARRGVPADRPRPRAAPRATRSARGPRHAPTTAPRRRAP